MQAVPPASVTGPQRFVLCAGLGLLIAPHVRPRWVVVPLIGGLGAMLALAWELAEYWLFMRAGKEAGGASLDILGAETLGPCGALLAGVVVASWTTRMTRATQRVGRKRTSPADRSSLW